MIENIKPQFSEAPAPEFDQYTKFQKKPELDVLWRDFEKSVQSKSKTKAPVVYIAIGFVAGLLVAFAISFVVWASTYSSMQQATVQKQEQEQKTDSKLPVTIVPSSETNEVEVNATGLEEKYTVKSGDTLDKIAYRFFGKYDPEKIEKIKKINNIVDETRIQIGQELRIPMD